MRTIKLNKHVLEIYDSIDELLIPRFHKFNKMLLIDSGTGSDLNDVNTRIARAIVYCKSNPSLAVKELENLQQTLSFIMSDLSPKYLAFCVLIKSIDKKPVTDISDEGLKIIFNQINDVTDAEITNELGEVKKKIDSELSLYFPGKFEDASVKDYFDLLKKRTLLLLDNILYKNVISKEIDYITDLLLTYSKPAIFRGPESIEIQYDKQYEDLCLLLSQKLNIQSKNLTVLEFYNAFDYLKKQVKSKNKKNG
jgi:hypothetical protein